MTVMYCVFSGWKTPLRMSLESSIEIHKSGVTSSPFLLNATTQHHLQLYCSSKPGLIDSLSRSLYVDDVVTGANTEDDAYQLYLESKEILSQASFNLRKFRSNSPHLQDWIDKREAALVTTVSAPGSSCGGLCVRLAHLYGFCDASNGPRVLLSLRLE